MTKIGTPVSSSHRNDAQLGDDDGRTDSSGDFLGGLDTQTNVSLRVSDDDNGLESCSLTGTGLLLDGLDLYVGEKNQVSTLSRQRENLSLKRLNIGPRWDLV